jgi:hypothetical protein
MHGSNLGGFNALATRLPEAAAAAPALGLPLEEERARVTAQVAV